MKLRPTLELNETELPEKSSDNFDKQQLYVEVPPSVHSAVKSAAARNGQKLQAFVVSVINRRVPSGEALVCFQKRGSPVGSASREKRISLILKIDEVVALKGLVAGFPSFREMVLSALEAEGIIIV